MPELAEIYLLKRFLDKNFKNETLTSFNFTNISKFHKKPPKYFKEFQQDLNLVLTNITRKGKILILNFNNKWWLGIHFGLHGFLRTDNIIVKNYDNNSKNISIINNPSTLFKFQFTLDKDLNMLRKLIKIYRRSDINKLPEEDIIQYDKYFKYITFLTNNKKNKELEDKKNIHKQIQLNKNEMYKHILPK